MVSARSRPAYSPQAGAGDHPSDLADGLHGGLDAPGVLVPELGEVRLVEVGHNIADDFWIALVNGSAATAFLVFLRSRWITASGVPLAQNRPTQMENSTSWPGSLSVGTSGPPSPAWGETGERPELSGPHLGVGAAIEVTSTCELLPRMAVSAGRRRWSADAAYRPRSPS
jgi:hypothetical protein